MQELTNHVVICNCNEKVKAIVEELQAGHYRPPMDVVLLIQDAVLWQANPSWHPVPQPGPRFVTLYGSPFDPAILSEACISKASVAIILADPRQKNLADAQSTLMAVAIEEQNPHVHTVQELILSINREHLKAMHVDEIVCLGDISEKMIAQSCISPGVKNIFEALLTSEKGTPQILLPSLPPALDGATFREIAAQSIRAHAPFIVIGYILNDNKHGRIEDAAPRMMVKRFRINPGGNAKDRPLSAGDQLIVIGYTFPEDLSRYAPLS